MVLTVFIVMLFIGLTQEGHLSAIGMFCMLGGCGEYQGQSCGSDQT